jgi:hypothetical protein
MSQTNRLDPRRRLILVQGAWFTMYAKTAGSLIKTDGSDLNEKALKENNNSLRAFNLRSGLSPVRAHHGTQTIYTKYYHFQIS